MARPARISEAILALLSERSRHAWSLEEMRADLAARRVRADFSTVFRAVERLVAEGRLRKIPIDGGSARFEPAGAHHDHVRCLVCDALTPIPCVTERVDLGALQKRTGFLLAGHDIVLQGTCMICRERAGAAPARPL